MAGPRTSVDDWHRILDPSEHNHHKLYDTSHHCMLVWLGYDYTVSPCYYSSNVGHCYCWYDYYYYYYYEGADEFQLLDSHYNLQWMNIAWLDCENNIPYPVRWAKLSLVMTMLVVMLVDLWLVEPWWVQVLAVCVIVYQKKKQSIIHMS